MTKFTSETVGHDGSRYSFTAEPDLITVRLVDANGGDALVVFEPRAMARFRDDASIAIVASGRTAVEMNADILANSIRIAFMRVDELKGKSPAEAERIYIAALAHVRSSCPQAFLAMEMKP